MKNKNTYIDGYNGELKTNKNDNDVKAIRIRDTKAKFFSAIFSPYLTAFQMYNTQLDEVKAEMFFGMQNLELSDLSRNKLTSLPSDAFYTLAKLKEVNFGENELEQIHNELFTNNLNLEKIVLGGNNIKYICSGLFNGLLKLTQVLLQDNICIDKNYQGSTKIFQLKEDIRKYCLRSNEIPTTATTTITTQNQRPVQTAFESHDIQLKKKLSFCEAKNQELIADLSMLSATKSFDISCEFKKTTNGYSC